MAGLLGGQLRYMAEHVDSSSAFAGKSYIGIYFAAQWCAACRAFTPHLIQWYNKHATRLGLEVVLVSSDSDPHSFEEFFGSMPWLALPYASRSLKEAISKRFRLTGIPTLVIVDAQTGQLCTTDGRKQVLMDSAGERFPWVPKAFLEVLTGDVLETDGTLTPCEDLQSLDALGIYFSAQWSPPCRVFTPILVESYNRKQSG